MATASNIATSARLSLGIGRKALLRAGIAGAALLVVAVLIPSSLADWLAVDNPLLAARIAPWNAAAAANAAAALKNPTSREARALVRRALDRDVTQIPAIELRALDLALSGQTGQARALFNLSDRLSRRSLPTRLWLIQDAVDRGSVAGALRNFDIALRTTTDAQPVLFPVLARASADPTLTVAIARLLDRPSDWRQMFFEWVLASGRDVSPVADIALHMKDRRFLASYNDDQRLIERLVTARHFSQARTLHPTDGLIADPNFRNPAARYPFGWGLVSNGSIRAERGTDGLSYHATPPMSGQVAAQLLTLTPGKYSLATRTATQGIGARPFWSVTCGDNDGGELVRLDQPPTRGSRDRAGFEVPSGCTGQWLTLSVRAAPDASPQSGSIAWVAITPL